MGTGTHTISQAQWSSLKASRFPKSILHKNKGPKSWKASGSLLSLSPSVPSLCLYWESQACQPFAGYSAKEFGAPAPRFGIASKCCIIILFASLAANAETQTRLNQKHEYVNNALHNKWYIYWGKDGKSNILAECTAIHWYQKPSVSLIPITPT